MTQTQPRLVTLGRVELIDAGTDAEPLNRRRRKLAVLAVLAIERRPMSRTQLTEMFWGAQPEARARHSLSDALSHLRRVLGSDALVTHGSMIQLRPGAVAVDALEMEAAAERRAWPEVVALHAGPFLAGVEVQDSDGFEDWLVRVRHRLDAVASTAYARQCDALAGRGEWASVLRLSARWMEAAPDDARARRFNERARDALSLAGPAVERASSAALEARWMRAAGGDGGICAVSGNAGDCRAATAALAARAGAMGAVTLAVQAYEGEATSTHRIAREVARAMADAPGLAGADAADLATLARLAPDLGERFGIVPSADAPSHVALVAAMRSALESIAYETPCLVIVDDAHLGDPASLAALRDAAASAEGPVLLVLSASPGALPDSATGFAERFAIEPAAAPSATTVPDVMVAPVTSRPWRALIPHPFATMVMAAVVLLVVALAAGTRIATRIEATGTTEFPVAGRLYQQGVREFTAGRTQRAGSLFEAALREDSTFAMAAHYLVHVRGTFDREAIGRALRLADGAPDRERLLIRATWFTELNDPRGGAAAETLLIRYPDELEAIVLYGRMLESRGDFTSAVRWLQQAVERDTAGLRGAAAACHACSALGVIKSASLFAGSFRTAEDAMQRLSATYHQDEQRAMMWMEIALVRARDERLDDAAAAIDSAMARNPAIDPTVVRLELMIRRGALDAADSVLRTMAASAAPAARMDALTRRVKVLRLQARHREAVAVARHVAALADTLSNGYMDGARILALAHLDHEPRRAAALFDSIATLPFHPDFPSREARHRAWMLTLAAVARVRASDTASLAQLADAVEQIGSRSAYGRDRRLHHHIRGLLWEARGDTARAVAAMRRARFSTTETYLGVRLARAELALGQVGDAIATAEGALRGPLDSQNQYESRTELHELLGEAYARAGIPAKARWHRAIVAASWRRADPEWAVRDRGAAAMKVALRR